MSTISPLENVRSRSVRKKFGRPNCYGGIFYGVSRYGDENPRAGYYRIRKIEGKKTNELLPFYYPSNPRTVEQQANRSKFSSAIAAWQLLDSTQKSNWRVLAYGKHMSGYNLFIRNFLLD